MPIFIEHVDGKLYAELTHYPNKGLVWEFCNQQAFPSPYGTYFHLGETDFSNGSRFFIADKFSDLDCCNHALSHTLDRGYIRPDGGFLGVRTHLSVSLYLLNTKESSLEQQGWIKVGQQNYGGKPVYWMHLSMRPETPEFIKPLTSEQAITLSRIGYDSSDPTKTELLDFTDVFKHGEPRAMRELRAAVAQSVAEKHQEVSADRARQIVEQLKAKLNPTGAVPTP